MTLVGCASSPKVGNVHRVLMGTPLQQKIEYGPTGPPAPAQAEALELAWDGWLPESVNTRTLSDKPGPI
jgi:hypothetical protein